MSPASFGCSGIPTIRPSAGSYSFREFISLNLIQLQLQSKQTTVPNKGGSILKLRAGCHPGAIANA